MLRLQKNWRSQEAWGARAAPEADQKAAKRSSTLLLHGRWLSLGAGLLALSAAFGCTSDAPASAPDAAVAAEGDAGSRATDRSQTDDDSTPASGSESRDDQTSRDDTSTDDGSRTDRDATDDRATTSANDDSNRDPSTTGGPTSDPATDETSNTSTDEQDSSESTSSPTSSNEDSSRPPLRELVGDHFAFGYSSYSRTRGWAGEVRESHGIDWRFMYWYHLIIADETVLPARLEEAKRENVVPILTHYQLLDRGTDAGYTGAEEWDVVTQAVQDPDVMREYFDNVQYLMEEVARLGGPMIFQTEPDSTTWLRQYHTNETWDANNGMVAVAASGHPDLADLDDTIAGYAQALVRLRDRYAPEDVYMGLCEFDNENGYNPERSVKYIQSLGAEFDVLFTHHVVKYSNRGEGWWDDYSETDQQRFLTWIRTITEGTGLPYIHWQTVIGSADYGLMPNYPQEERISDLVEAGSIACLFDVYEREGPPHSQPWHGYSSSPPPEHPAYNSLDKLAERLQRYYQDPIPLNW